MAYILNKLEFYTLNIHSLNEIVHQKAEKEIGNNLKPNPIYPCAAEFQLQTRRLLPKNFI